MIQKTIGEGETEVRLDTGKLLHLLLKNLWLIGLAAVTAAAVMFAVTTKVIPAKYETTLSMCVYNDSDAQVQNESDLHFSQELMNTYVVAFDSRSVLDQIARELDYRVTVDELQEAVTATAIPQSITLSITVQHTQPQTVKDIADAVAKVMPEQLIQITRSGQVEVIDQPIVPEDPVFPNIWLLTALGFLAGLLGMSMVLICVHVLDDKIYTKDDLEEYSDIPVVGVIPHIPD